MKKATDGHPHSSFRLFNNIADAEVEVGFSKDDAYILDSLNLDLRRSHNSLKLGEPIPGSVAAFGVWIPGENQMIIRIVNVYTEKILYQSLSSMGGSQLIADFIAIAVALKYFTIIEKPAVVYSDNEQVINGIDNKEYKKLFGKVKRGSETYELLKKSAAFISYGRYPKDYQKWLDIWGAIPGQFVKGNIIVSSSGITQI